MPKLPKDLPANSREAFARIKTVTRPSLDDLKLMVLVEAAGLGAYGGLADATPHAEMKAIFNRNGQEEVAHATRVSRVIEIVFGERFPVPAPEENPYFERPAGMVVNHDMLEKIATGEDGGEALYEGWAATIGNDEAAQLLRQNGKEEARHGARIRDAMAYL